MRKPSLRSSDSRCRWTRSAPGLRRARSRKSCIASWSRARLIRRWVREMPTFRYRAYGDQGELAQGSVEAASQTEATEVLFLRGLTAFHLEAAVEAATPWWQREVFTSRRSLATELTALTREMATLIGADIPVDQ